MPFYRIHTRASMRIRTDRDPQRRSRDGQQLERAMADSVSIVRGMPLSEEPWLGELTLSGFIRQVAERFSNREALVQRRRNGTMERWSYRELWDRSIEVAKALVACGLAKGERVGVLMTNRAEFLSAAFGTALARVIAPPLITFSTPHELQ